MQATVYVRRETLPVPYHCPKLYRGDARVRGEGAEGVFLALELMETHRQICQKSAAPRKALAMLPKLSLESTGGVLCPHARETFSFSITSPPLSLQGSTRRSRLQSTYNR